MLWLIKEVNVCDYGDDEPGSCLTDKTENVSTDAVDYIFTRCNGCGREHICAVISTERLKLKDGVQFANGMKPKSKQPSKVKRAGIKKSVPKKR